MTRTESPGPFLTSCLTLPPYDSEAVSSTWVTRGPSHSSGSAAVTSHERNLKNNKAALLSPSGRTTVTIDVSMSLCSESKSFHSVPLSSHHPGQCPLPTPHLADDLQDICPPSVDLFCQGDIIWNTIWSSTAIPRRKKMPLFSSPHWVILFYSDPKGRS